MHEFILPYPIFFLEASFPFSILLLQLSKLLSQFIYVHLSSTAGHTLQYGIMQECILSLKRGKEQLIAKIKTIHAGTVRASTLWFHCAIIFMYIMYLCLNHVVPLFSQVGDVVERVDNTLFYSTLQLHVNGGQGTSTANSSTIQGGRDIRINFGNNLSMIYLPAINAYFYTMTFIIIHVIVTLYMAVKKRLLYTRTL